MIKIAILKAVESMQSSEKALPHFIKAQEIFRRGK
jgi:hypothetical protein